MTTALVDFNRSDAAFPTTGYPELLAGQAARTPTATALAQGDRTWTYAELQAATNRLAHALIARGAGPGTRIGLCYPRSAEYVLGSLAILKTGAAIVALDPVNPDDRLAAMIADAGPLLVLAPAELARRIPEDVPRAEVATAGQGHPDTAPASVTGPETVSHLIYTSGSTGTPKAVLERHGALTNLVHWTTRAYGVRPGDRASWMSTPASPSRSWSGSPTSRPAPRSTSPRRARHRPPSRSATGWPARASPTPCWWPPSPSPCGA